MIAIAPQTMLLQLYSIDNLRQIYAAVLTPLEAPSEMPKEAMANEIWTAAAGDRLRLQILHRHLKRTYDQYNAETSALADRGAELMYSQSLANLALTRVNELYQLGRRT